MGVLLVTQITGSGLLTEGENNTKFYTYKQNTTEINITQALEIPQK